MEPNKEYLDGKTPTIQAAGLTWPVPMFGPEQNEVIVPAALYVLPRIANVVHKGQIKVKEMVGIVDTPMMQTLYDMTYWALKRAHRTLTREEFNQMPVTAKEVLSNISVITEQTGLFTPSTGDKKPGEEEASNQ
jgi:hypothetical protein